MIWVQTDKKKPLWKEVLLVSLLSSLVLFTKASMQRVALGRDKIGMGPKGGGGGMIDAPLPLVEPELLLPPATLAGSAPLPCQPGHLKSRSL